jgi:hypothetical protein
MKATKNERSEREQHSPTRRHYPWQLDTMNTKACLQPDLSVPAFATTQQLNQIREKSPLASHSRAAEPAKID